MSCRALAVPDGEEVEAEGEVRRYDCDVGKDEIPIYQLLYVQRRFTKKLIGLPNSAAKQVGFSCSKWLVSGNDQSLRSLPLPLLMATHDEYCLSTCSASNAP